LTFLTPTGVERRIQIDNLEHRVGKCSQEVEVVALDEVRLGHSPKLTE
jgi:hypothetical protein